MDKKRFKRLLTISALSAFLISIPYKFYSQQSPIHFVNSFRVCAERTDLIPIGDPIPVGCDLIDCCPNCPGPLADIDWKINLLRNKADSVVINFTGLTEEAKKGLKNSGNGKWLSTTRFQLNDDESLIKGFKGSDNIVAHLEYKIHEGAKEDLMKVSPEDVLNQGIKTGSIDVQIRQYQDVHLVAYHRPLIIYGPCGINTNLTFDNNDYINLHNKIGEDKAVVMLDSMSVESCINDRVYQQTGTGNTLTLPNIQPNVDECKSEVAIFSEDNAMYFDDSLNWAMSNNERYDAHLTETLELPVTLWIYDSSLLNTALADIEYANSNLNANKAGIKMVVIIQDVTGNQDALDAVNHVIEETPCYNQPALRRSDYFIKNRLNIYYVYEALPSVGYNCGQYPNITVIGTLAKTDTLAHEMGHAFSLDHVDDEDYDKNRIVDLSPANMMWPGSITRSNFTISQVFRMNINIQSIINTNGIRTGITRECIDKDISKQCPWIAVDVLPD